MKIIFKIARTELRNLFYSPVAWFLGIAFLVQCAVFYMNALIPYAKWQEVYLSSTPKWKDFGSSMTAVIFLSGDSIISNVLQNLYLFVPLLTMGLISREAANGTIKLLYSSPVKVRHIVLGKYLAIMAYNMLLVGIVGIFMITAFFNIRSLDHGLLLSALLGFYLLLCAYTAIGMFMSSLTNYQIVSAIGSFILVFILSRIGSLWQKYNFVRDLTYFLSMAGRTGKFMRGLITSKDIIYFLAIMSIFTGFTLIRLRGGRESKPWYVKALRYVAVFSVALMAGYIGSRPMLTLYWDTTATKFNTIHPPTQALIKQLGKDPLEVTLYSNLLGPGVKQGLPEERNNYFSTLWEPYARFKPDIKFNYVYYYDIPDGDSSYYRSFPHKTLAQIADRMAVVKMTEADLYEPPPVIRKSIDLGPENYRLVMQLKYKGRSIFVRTFEDPEFWPDEEQIAGAFKHLLRDSFPKVYFLTGNLERSIYKHGEREFRFHATEKGYRTSLLNLGIGSDTICLDRQDLPKDPIALVLADPKTKLSDTTLGKLREYIDKGGNLLVYGEPGKQQMVNPVLRQLGLQLMPGTIVEPTEYEMPQMVRTYVTEPGTELADHPMLMHLRESYKEHDKDDSLKMLMPGVAAIAGDSVGPFTVEPLTKSVGSRTWLKQGAFVSDSAEIQFSDKEGDVRGAFSTAVRLTRKVGSKEQRIIVCGDADFMSNSRGSGSFFGPSFYSWLDFGEFPVFGHGAKSRDTLLLIKPKTADLLSVVFVWILPALVLVLGTILLIRRKRK